MSEGRPLWELPTAPGDVLYLCLEDTFYRIQDRLFRLADEASERLRFAVASCKLTDGLVGQLEDYLKECPGTRLIVIDTLQKVRTASKDNAYANDYGDISLLKDFADRHALAVVVVHHIRKQGDSDVFNRVSGTTGLTGSADATFVLEKEHRASDTAALYAIGRDIEYQEFTLRFRDCSWELVERKSQEQLAAAEVPPILFRLVAFMDGRREWSGTATELLTQTGETDTAPNVITKLLNEYHATEIYFPMKNVRYIAVNDCVDTANKNNDIAALKNVMNEFYSRDNSRKIRSSIRARAKAGLYRCSYAPLGYRKAPDNHNKLIVDEETAWIVKRIFEYANAGMGSHKIASTLRKEQVP